MNNTRRIQCRCNNVSIQVECSEGQDTVQDVLVSVSGMYLMRSVQDKDSQQSNLIQKQQYKSHCLICQCDICVIQGTGTTTDQAEGGVILFSQAVDYTLKSRFIRLLDGLQVNIVAQDTSPLQQPNKDLDQWASILNSMQQVEASVDSVSVDQYSVHLQRVVQMAMKDYQTRLKLERDEQMRQINDKYESRLLAAQQVFTRIKADLQSVLPKSSDPGKTNSMAPSFNQSQIPQESAQSQIQRKPLEQTTIDNDDDNDGVFELDMEGRQQQLQQGVSRGSLMTAQTYREEDNSIDEQDEDLQQNEHHSGADQVMVNTSILSQSMPINIKSHMQSSSIVSHHQKEQQVQGQKQQQRADASQNHGDFVAPHVLSMQTFKHSDPFAEYKPTSSSVIRNRSNHNRFT
ncbi:hypothetical protein MP228_001879 [Amoeboaphelidium protococcarum]|nr:hypothetical protein MP228_001879 [Amoeboaphelidium protococcarum]